MSDDRATEIHDAAVAQSMELREDTERRKRPVKEARRAAPRSHRLKMGRETIWLAPVEFRILQFLSARPYHAYTRRRIAGAITTERHPVAEETLDQHIASLREKLGFFADYIQTVPYIGYRFKT